MTREIEIAILHTTEKANDALTYMNHAKTKFRKDFYHGQYLAFKEILSLLKNI